MRDTIETSPAYIRHLVTYRDKQGRTAESILRIRDDRTDLAQDARRQLIGNHMSVSEILTVERA